MTAPRAIRRLRSVFLAAALAAAGCTVGPNYRTPQMPVPDRFGDAPQPPAIVNLANWWKSFNDPELNALVYRAIRSSLDLKQAQARILEARAQRVIAGAAELPTVNVQGGYIHNRTSQNLGAFSAAGASGAGGGGGSAFAIPGLEQDLYQAGFDASWEVDVFGGVRRSVQAANADYAAAVFEKRDVLVTLLAELARNYVDLRGFQRQLSIANDNVKTEQQTLELTQSRFKAGLTSELDVDRAQAQVSTTAAQIPALETQVAAAARRIAVLVGLNPSALQDELSAPVTIPVGPTEVPPGLPSELLRRRPDIRRAERQIAAASARVGVATADLFPKFSLTGNFTFESGKVSNLFDWGSRSYSIGPSISWPLFDAGRIRANIRVQNAREEELVAGYQKTVLSALEDVENSLNAHRQEQVRRRSLIDAVNANKRATELSNDLYSRGVIDFLTVLDSERALFASQDALAQSDRTVSTNLVAVFKSLGGGWEAGEPAAATQPAAAPAR